MHYDNFIQTAALKQGFATEIHAKQKYQPLQSKVHKGLKIENVGFMIPKEHPFIPASPNCLVICKCCGDGLLQVKSHKFQLFRISWRWKHLFETESRILLSNSNPISCIK